MDDDDVSSESDLTGGNTDLLIKNWTEYDETGGEYLPRPEAGPALDFELRETTKPSEDKLVILKDPRYFMLDQLKTVLYNLITHRPENAVDYFEEYVRFVITKGGEIVEKKVNIFKYYFDKEKLLNESSRWETLAERAEGSEDEEIGGENVFPKLKTEYIFLNRMGHFGDGGVYLTLCELYSIAIGMQLVAKDFELQNVRFWGKIFGLYRNYYILEADITKGLYMTNMEEEKVQKLIDEDETAVVRAEEQVEEYNPKIRWERVKKLKDYIKPPMPKLEYKAPNFAPKEKFGSGLNNKVYFASNEPGKDYIRLPDVLPVHIVRARQIKRFFTGLFDAEVNSTPEFPGKERNYLRAQIARITAGTHISPLGFFSFYAGEAAIEEELEEAGGGELPKPEVVVNPDYAKLPLQDLVDPSMAFWAHHAAHILPQGRAKWIDPNISKAKLKGEGGEEEPQEKAVPEVGPPLLTTASEDMNLEMIAPWSTRLTMDLSPSFGAAFVRSNLWPGAFTYALFNENQFENIYIGWGLKYNATSFTPLIHFIPQKEYEIGPEILEITDPDPEEEDYEGILYEQKLAEEKQIKKLKKNDNIEDEF